MYRTLFISDVHLGTRGCQADRLLEFLDRCSPETIYLVGDIIDYWQLRLRWYWPKRHNDVVRKLVGLARNGVRIVYLPGNHDELLRRFPETLIEDIEVVDTVIHQAADGRCYLVLHGDIFDFVVTYAPWIARLGGLAYGIMIIASRYLNNVRRCFGFPYWSLSQWIKQNVKNAVNYIAAFEHELAKEARRHHVDGVICGHIHHATIRDTLGIRYINCGDWVESCTAIAEHDDGRMEIVAWTRHEAAVLPFAKADYEQREVEFVA